MSSIEFIKPVTIVCTADPETAKPFYRDVLGLKLSGEDTYATTFEIAGIKLRLSTVRDFAPHAHTVIGFAVADIAAAARALGAKGVKFDIYEGFGQDDAGVWTSPGGDTRVAWFNDPDGNVLSLTQF